MLAVITRCVVLGLLVVTSGCAICSSCDDDTYGAYGGRWERADRTYGRVGSAFTPEVGYPVDGGEYVDGEIVEGQVIENGRTAPVEPTPAPNPVETIPSEETLPQQPPRTTSRATGKSADNSVLLRRPKTIR